MTLSQDAANVLRHPKKRSLANRERQIFRGYGDSRLDHTVWTAARNRRRQRPGRCES